MTMDVTSARYAERVYAGVLGKMIGVYLGRPVEGWGYEAIGRVFGETDYYVNGHAHFGEKKPALVVTDDDLSGTFTFFRALGDWGFDANLTCRQVGRCWMNYVIEGRTILWWGGMGLSTEQTAYLRMKAGIEPPRSGSIALNGAVVAEQIGSQIFCDAWGLVSPGDVPRAARLAREAARVSHDGEAVYGAQVVAGLVAAAFVDPDIGKMLDAAVAEIPADCLIARMIGDIRAWVKDDGDWRVTRGRIAGRYGYDKYGGNCHIVPNHALVILALLYSPGDFSEALKIVNTCGWDTDCNAANVGCVMGVRLGLEGIQARHDWRGPVEDRLFLPTADGGRAITDAVLEGNRIVAAAHEVAGKPFTPPKGGARYSFCFPGSVQGWQGAGRGGRVENVASPFEEGERALAIHGAAEVATFVRPGEWEMGGYELLASPVLYAGQKVTATVWSPEAGRVRWRVTHYGAGDAAETLDSPWEALAAGVARELAWTVPETGGNPFYQLGLEAADRRTVIVDRVEIAGTPRTRLFPDTPTPGDKWRRAWVNAVSQHWKVTGDGHETWTPGPALWVVQNQGMGQLSTGGPDWKDYRFSVTARPHLAEAFGIAVAVNGLHKGVRLMIRRDGLATLVWATLAGVRELARAPVAFELYRFYELGITWAGGELEACVDGRSVFGKVRWEAPPTAGGVALLVDTGRVFFRDARVEPV